MRKLSFSKLFLLLILIGISSLVSAQKTFLYCGKLIDGISDEAQSEMTLVLEGNKIIAVNKGYTPAEPGAVVIDLKNKTVLPGLMDMHVHLEEQSHKNAFVETFTLNPADIAFRSLGFAETTLLAGFTTVRDLGGTGVNISLRNAINKGLVKGPRIYTAGKAISGTGGHMDPTNGYREDLMGNPGPESGVANGPDECRKAVRQQYKSGADLIKIASTGGVLSVAKDGSAPMFSEAEIRAIVETANDLGMKVACHAHGAEGIKRAIRAGVTSIEHGSLMDAEGIELMKKYGTWYVPTLTAGRSVADSAKIPGYYPDIVTPKALSIGPRLQETFGRAYKAGVKIAFGTDAGVYAHGRNAMEFVYMTEGGMTPMQAIKSATMNAAELLGIKDKLGSLQAGKLADIIALDENPLSNIKALQHVVFVMKDGVVYKK
jgi:imidazolonepropionase-like amidohydrolase